MIVRVLNLHRKLLALAVDDHLGDMVRSAGDRRVLRGNLHRVARVVQIRRDFGAHNLLLLPIEDERDDIAGRDLAMNRDLDETGRSGRSQHDVPLLVEFANAAWLWLRVAMCQSRDLLRVVLKFLRLFFFNVSAQTVFVSY